jgi:hypothetical protein
MEFKLIASPPDRFDGHPNSNRLADVSQPLRRFDRCLCFGDGGENTQHYSRQNGPRDSAHHFFPR